MKKYALILLLALSGTALAVPSQSDLAALANAEREGQQEVDRKRAAYKAKLEREAAAARAQRAAAQRRADARRAAAEAERKEDKARHLKYEDELRDLNLQRQKLALEREAKRVKREDDFIDAELKREAARTDVLQADADAVRDIGAGTGDLLRKTGEAQVKKESGWFN